MSDVGHGVHYLAAEMGGSRLQLSRAQILSYRRRVNELDTRLQQGAPSLRKAAWAGLQDSMPRAALLSIHARVESTPPSVLDEPSLIQVWGPRFSVFVIAAEDRPVFTIGRMPQDEGGRQRSEGLASRIAQELGRGERPFADVGRAIGLNPNALRYATTTGTILLNWDGARQPTIRVAPRPDVDVIEMRHELARRYLHIFGPSTAESFSKWAGVRLASAAATFDELRPALTTVSTPIGDASILTADEQSVRDDGLPPEGIRLLPSGDAYYLLQGDDRALLVPNDANRSLLWTSRVWPGAVLERGEIIGVWRRSKNKVTIEPWGKVTKLMREAVEAEAGSLPLPGDVGEIRVAWGE
jgi:DNA glycosylase AlkZ-like